MVPHPRETGRAWTKSDYVGAAGSLIGATIWLGATILRPGDFGFLHSIGLTLFVCAIAASGLLRMLREGAPTDGTRTLIVAILAMTAATLGIAILGEISGL